MVQMRSEAKEVLHIKVQGMVCINFVEFQTKILNFSYKIKPFLVEI